MPSPHISRVVLAPRCGSRGCSWAADYASWARYHRRVRCGALPVSQQRVLLYRQPSLRVGIGQIVPSLERVLAYAVQYSYAFFFDARGGADPFAQAVGYAARSNLGATHPCNVRSVSLQVGRR